MLPRSYAAVAVTALAALVLSEPLFAEPQVVRYIAAKDDVARFKMTMHGETTIYVEDQTQVTVIDNEMFLTQRVTDVEADKDVVTFQTKIDAGKMAINGVDTILPMIGQVLQTKMRSNGEILSSIGSANQNLDNMQLVFPEKAVDVGSNWKIDIPANAQVPVPLVMQYKVAGFEVYRGRKCVKLTTSITSGQSAGIEGMSLELDAKGKIYFDYEKGQMVDNRVNSDMRMIIKRVINGKATQIITRMDMKVHLELI